MNDGGLDLKICELRGRLSPETALRRDEPLAGRTTFRIGGKADLFVEPASEADLAAVIGFCGRWGLERFVLGRGSNLLVRDGGFRGAVISLEHPFFCGIEIEGDILRCGAGAKLKAVALEACKSGVSGFEFMEGIPGTVGGALRMNAGAMGGATFDRLEKLRVMDGQGRVGERARAELTTEYRCCPLLRTHIALEAEFRGTLAPKEEILERMEGYRRKRWAAQPKEPSAGCIFKNPASIPAGKLIDELGLKGACVGGALVSTVHGNFIVNKGEASARDVLNLISLVKEKARLARNIDLETEVQIVGHEA